MDEHTGAFSCSIDVSETSAFPFFNRTYISEYDLPPELGDFRLCQCLGRGAVGTVHRVTQTKEYALKVIPWNKESLRDEAMREYETATLFADCETTVHPIALYEYGQKSFILEELGEPILDYFFGHSCNLRMLLNTLLDVSDALSFIHDKGYAHFDVKPDNIFVVHGKARIGDFSHCFSSTPGQEYIRFLGTNSFRAPETLNGKRQSGLEDMYSFGITIYALLMAGKVPFKTKDRCENKDLQISSLFIPPDLLSIIRKAAAFSPEERYQSFNTLSEDIHAFMQVNNDLLDERVPAYLAANPREQTFTNLDRETVTVTDVEELS